MEQKYTSGPWRWELNEKSKEVHLSGGKPTYDKTVMDFVRYGMGGAAPRFNECLDGTYNFMERCEKFGKAEEGREHHAHWFKTLDHPDARLIAAAPDLLEALQAYVNNTYSGCSKEELDELRVKAEAAIAKALGNAVLH